MGSYLNFKLEDPSLAPEANRWLEEQPEQQRLRELRDRRLWFWTEEDREIEKKKENGVPDFHDLGEGQIKASGLGIEHDDEIKRLWASLFEKLHEQFDVKVLSTSCAMSTTYFSREQLCKLTNNGEALSGDAKAEIQDLLDEQPT